LGLIGGRLHLSGGYRHEAMDDAFGSAGTTTIANNLNAWEVGSSFEISKGLQVRAQYARSLRLPALDERYMAAIPAWFIPASLNTNLLPQTGRHLSAAITYATDILHAELEFSQADISDEIFYNPATFANENYTSKTRHDVIRAAVGWDINDMAKLEASYSQVKATFRGGSYSGNRVPSVADNVFGASWRAEWLAGLSSLVKVSYVGSSFFVSDQANANPKLPSYTVWDVMVNYRYGELDLFAGVDNVTNENYATYAAYTSVYPAAGMQLKAGASYSF
jgi:outer membrane receptor protein involved in Fe transport